jgi:hypothetical protein
MLMLKFGRIAAVSTAALTLAVATIPSKAEAFGPGPDIYGYGPVVLAPVGGYYGAGCGCQVYAPPPPPPPCCPPPPRCCAYGGGRYNGADYGYRGGYDGGYGGGYRGGYDDY